MESDRSESPTIRIESESVIYILIGLERCSLKLDAWTALLLGVNLCAVKSKPSM